MQDETKDVYLGGEFDHIRDWAANKGIYRSGDPKTQYLKLMEEAGELADAILKNDRPEQIDAIGDCVVVLTNLAFLLGFDIEHAINAAWDEIKDRTGKMEGGTFVKDTPKNDALSFCKLNKVMAYRLALTAEKDAVYSCILPHPIEEIRFLVPREIDMKLFGEVEAAEIWKFKQ